MALWTRNLSSFNLKLEWHGKNKILVKTKSGKTIDVVTTRSFDPAVVGRAMRNIEEEMYRVATACER